MKSTQDYHTTREPARGSRQIWDSLAQHTYVCTWWWKSRLGDLPRYAWEEFSLPHQRLSPWAETDLIHNKLWWLFKKQARELMISLGKRGKDREESLVCRWGKEAEEKKQGLEEHLEMEGPQSGYLRPFSNHSQVPPWIKWWHGLCQSTW